MAGRILVVDDDPTVRDLLEVIIRDADRSLTVATASDGTEALAVIRRDRPDVVLLDIRMPGLSGLEVLRELRARDPALPVIMLTGDASDEAFLGAMRAEAFAYIRKPCDVRYIQHLVAAALQAARPSPAPAERPS